MQINQLNTLIGLLVGDLSKRDRQNIMTICTIDVHAKDVVGKLVEQKVCFFNFYNNINTTFKEILTRLTKAHMRIKTHYTK